ncbi:hypothetical protein V1523DRAFT_418968 [Lipomyces doorenjongii]
MPIIEAKDISQFMYKFGYEISPGKWVIRAQDQQVLSAASAAIVTGFQLLRPPEGHILGVLDLFCRHLHAVLRKEYHGMCSGKIISSLGIGLGHSIGTVLEPEIWPVRLESDMILKIDQNVMITSPQWVQCFRCIFCQSKQPTWPGEFLRLPMYILLLAFLSSVPVVAYFP